jgi:NAD(P)-dependent dehydrogenase (short-subunit alcohol dehydrogenase family)
MTESTRNVDALPVAMIIGATTKWQAQGESTLHSHGAAVDDAGLPATVRWGMGGAIALKFAQEGHFTVLTTRRRDNAEGLAEVIRQDGGQCMIVELDVTSEESDASAFAEMRKQAGDPEIVIYNVGYFYGRDLPPEMELLENTPVEIYDKALLVAGRGPFLVAKQALPAMRKRGCGSIFFSNNPSCLHGRRRRTGESLYYPRVLERALAQVLADEYTEHGIHAANVIVAGLIDSPGTRALDYARERPEILMDPARIADTFFYLHMQHPSCWSYEIEIGASGVKPAIAGQTRN